jgi:two-component system response regulator AdeR
MYFNYSLYCAINQQRIPLTKMNGRKIAIVEDNESIRSMYRTKLELDGFTVDIASNGIDGLQLAENFKPDLILLDLRMPELNGDEMLVRLRATDWGCDIRIIILTNVSRDEAPHILRFLSVDRYIVKAHYTPSQVVEVVKQVLHIH